MSNKSKEQITVRHNFRMVKFPMWRATRETRVGDFELSLDVRGALISTPGDIEHVDYTLTEEASSSDAWQLPSDVFKKLGIRGVMPRYEHTVSYGDFAYLVSCRLDNTEDEKEFNKRFILLDKRVTDSPSDADQVTPLEVTADNITGKEKLKTRDRKLKAMVHLSADYGSTEDELLASYLNLRAWCLPCIAVGDKRNNAKVLMLLQSMDPTDGEFGKMFFRIQTGRPDTKYRLKDFLKRGVTKVEKMPNSRNALVAYAKL